MRAGFLLTAGIFALAGCAGAPSSSNARLKNAQEEFADTFDIACSKYKSDVTPSVLAARSVRVVRLSSQRMTYDELRKEDITKEDGLFVIEGWRCAYRICGEKRLQSDQARRLVAEFVAAWAYHGRKVTLPPFGFFEKFAIEMTLLDGSSMKFLVGDKQIAWFMPPVPGLYRDPWRIDTIPWESSLELTLETICPNQKEDLTSR